MIQDAAFQELRTKHNLNEADSEELSRYLKQMRDLPPSVSYRTLREEHRRLRRVLSHLTRGNEALQRDVLYLLWEMSKGSTQRRIEDRRDRRTKNTQDVI